MNAFDINSNYSGYSNEASINGYKIDKIIKVTERKKIDQEPSEFSLSQNYPNPFNPSTKINYNVPFDTKVTISVYSITGQLLFEKALANDNNRLVISTSNFNNGLYFYRIIVDKAVVANEKLMIIK